MNMRCVAGFAVMASVAFAAETPLTVGLIRNPVSGLIALADQKGWFKENGTDFQSVLFSGAAGPKVLQAMGGGSIGVGTVSVTAALLALASGAVPLKIISIATDPAPLFAILSIPDIDDVAKLAGKKVATTAGTGLQYFLVRALQKHGMTLKDVVFENMAALADTSAALTGDGEPVQVPAALVGWSFFDVLRVRPELGRTFRARR